jgi:hypothetical protein
VPKNKAPNAFIQDIKEGNFQTSYLSKKQSINDLFEGIRDTTTLPKDHSFGMKNKERTENLKDVLKNVFCPQSLPKELENLEQTYRP